MEAGLNGVAGMDAQQHVVVEFIEGPDSAKAQPRNTVDMDVAQMVHTISTGSFAMSMIAPVLVCRSCVPQYLKCFCSILIMF